METGNPIVDAQTAFSRQRRRRRAAQAKRWLLRHPRECGRLPSLDNALGTPATWRRQVGMKAVRLDSIVGTAESSKARAFDDRFRPPPTSRHRWERLWVAARRGEPLPPVSLYQLGEEHFLVDGHHRVSVAHDLGMHAIDAEVTQLG
jgi:hypothetical protein